MVTRSRAPMPLETGTGPGAGSTIFKAHPARHEIDVASLAGWRLAVLEPCRIHRDRPRRRVTWRGKRLF
jgi:hypothetical protein